MFKRLIVLTIALCMAWPLGAWAKPLVLTAAKAELDRSIKEYQGQEIPPYFIGYGITETIVYNISASFGKIITDNFSHDRVLDIDLRVGDYQLDNTHIIRGGSGFSFGSAGGAVQLPIEDDIMSLRNAIWFATDASYKSAIEKYEKVLTNKAVKVKEEDSSADLSHDKVYQHIEDFVELKFDRELWKDRVRRLSQLFAAEDLLYYGNVSLKVQVTNKYFVSSEGAEIAQSEPYVRIFLATKTKADDGMSLPLYKSYFAFDIAGLPTEDTMKQDINNMVRTLMEMRDAPIMTTYSGPCILSGEASGVFFHEIFGHRVEGHKLKDPNNAQTFKNSLGEEILPTFMGVTFDPTIKEIRGKQLSGYYKYDDEGIEGQKVEIVKDGIFKNFLMSRSPVEGFDYSNGHGRRQPGRQAVSRQSNLIVSTNETVTLDELKEELREECRKQDKEYGLYFGKVTGGFTFTGRSIPNSFNVTPLIVYKIYVDGRPDELVRGVDLIGTPLTTFSNIIRAADDMQVFNGMCGAESGSVPVSAVSPHLLVSKIEVQKKSKSQAKPPILPAPELKTNP